MANYHYENREKNIGEVLTEMKAEASAFINTRYELFVAEIKEKADAWKKSIPMLIAAAIFGMGTFATLTFTLVALVAGLIRNSASPNSSLVSFAWPIGAAIICVLYGCTAAALGTTGYKRLTAQSLTPERTMRVLRQDQNWIQEEASRIKNEARAA